MVGTKQPDLALIQIATQYNVYILDVTTIGQESKELWAELATILFENKNILKLGNYALKLKLKNAKLFENVH